MPFFFTFSPVAQTMCSTILVLYVHFGIEQTKMRLKKEKITNRTTNSEEIKCKQRTFGWGKTESEDNLYDCERERQRERGKKGNFLVKIKEKYF